MTEQLGWLDTNLFVHSLYPNDPHCAPCRAHLRDLRDGRAEGWIDATVVHELTYVLIRRSLFPTRDTINQYIRSHLVWDSIRADDKDGLLEALARWTMQGVGFVDAWLAVLGQRRALPVCSVNQADFSGVPNTYRADTP